MTQAINTLSLFEEQRKNRKRTGLFLLIGITWIGSLGFWGTFAQLFLLTLIPAAFTDYQYHPWHSQMFRWSIWGAIAALLLWIAISSILFFQSGRAFPRIVGARRAAHEDAMRLRRLLNSVALAAGNPDHNLRLFVWETSGVNAFAAGRSLKSGSIVVTRELLRHLADDELKTVLAHEFSHLKNRDSIYLAQASALVTMLVAVGAYGTALTLVVVAATTAVVYLLGAIAVGAFAEIDDLREFLFAVIVACCIFVLMVRVILTGVIVAILCAVAFGLVVAVVGLGLSCSASAVSHSREYLADACAAQWTRQPDRLASALEKVHKATGNLQLRHLFLQPLFFAKSSIQDNRKKIIAWLHQLLKTHPPIRHRIAVLRQMHGTIAVAQGLVKSQDRCVWKESTKDWVVPLASSLALGLISMYGAYELSLVDFRPPPAAPAESEEVPAIVGIVNQPVVRLRNGPSVQTRILARVSKGTVVEILDEADGQGREMGWYRVRVNGQTGWIARRLVDSSRSSERTREPE